MMTTMSNRGKGNETFVVLVDFWVKSIGNEELGSSLRVSKVNNLISTSDLSDIVKVRWNIILSHFVEGEIPELSLISIVLYMFV